MPLTHTRELFAKALKGKYAIGAFNVNNMELLQAIIEACEEEKAPVILQISKGARQYANPVYLKKLIEAAEQGRHGVNPPHLTVFPDKTRSSGNGPNPSSRRHLGQWPNGALPF